MQYAYPRMPLRTPPRRKVPRQAPLRAAAGHGLALDYASATGCLSLWTGRSPSRTCAPSRPRVKYLDGIEAVDPEW